MDDRSVADPLDAIHQRELNELKSLTVHRDFAVAAALDYCVEHGVTAPRWVVEEAAKLMRELLMREKAPGRGRAGNRISRYGSDQWDVERWDAVEAIRRIKKKTKYEAELRRQHGETS